MPVKRRLARGRRPDLEILTREQERTLLYGRGFVGPALDDESFETAWQMHRERLLPKWIAEHPGTRPAAWWRIDSKIGPHPPYRRADYAGIPAGSFVMEDGQPVCVTENEGEYLRRHGLLTPAEIYFMGEPEADE